MKHISQIAGAVALLFTLQARADVGPDYVCQHKDAKLQDPKGTVDYWNNILTSWTNSRSGEVEVFLRGPLLVTEPTLITESGKDERWLVPPKPEFPAQGVFLTFSPDECVSLDGKPFYCLRNREEANTPILAAGRDSKAKTGKNKQARETLVQAKSVQAVMSQDQYLVTFVLTNGKRVTLSENCTSTEWYPHIPKDELNRSDK